MCYFISVNTELTTTTPEVTYNFFCLFFSKAITKQYRIYLIYHSSVKGGGVIPHRGW